MGPPAAHFTGKFEGPVNKGFEGAPLTWMRGKRREKGRQREMGHKYVL